MRVTYPKTVSKTKPESGFGLLLTLFAMGVMILTLGSAIDFSHIYLVQGELQALADELALRAAGKLDGTREGVARAEGAIREALAGDQRAEWLTLSTDDLRDVQPEFAAAAEGPWQDSPGSADGLRFVRVTANAGAQLFFLPMLPKMPASQRVVVRAVAGQSPRSEYKNEGIGWTVDAAGSALAPGASYRVRSAEAASCERAFSTRYLQDTDTATSSYTEYLRTGNGRRVLIARVNGSEDGEAAYATLLLQRDSGETCAATYVGSAPVLGAGRNGPGPPGLYELRLY